MVREGLLGLSRRPPDSATIALECFLLPIRVCERLECISRSHTQMIATTSCQRQLFEANVFGSNGLSTPHKR